MATNQSHHSEHQRSFYFQGNPHYYNKKEPNVVNKVHKLFTPMFFKILTMYFEESVIIFWEEPIQYESSLTLCRQKRHNNLLLILSHYHSDLQNCKSKFPKSSDYSTTKLNACNSVWQNENFFDYLFIWDENL